MLSREDNELVCRVGPGTPMGALMREYWVPALLSSELPKPDSDPVRVMLLGERLVAFRDTDGNVGLMPHACPHRGASLYFGRNEEDGLRCVYHGWKFDVGGRCLDMPNEPAESNFKDKVSARSYPCVERAGVVWTYLGPREEPPPFPRFEALEGPPEATNAIAYSVDANWLQVMEGDEDPTHFSFLHAGHVPASSAPEGLLKLSLVDRAPRHKVLDTPGGVLCGTSRPDPDDPDQTAWGMMHFCLPFHTLTGVGLSPNIPVNGMTEKRAGLLSRVPMDDGHTMTFSITVGIDIAAGGAAIPPNEYLALPLVPNTTDWYGRFRWKQNAENDYLIDRDAQRRNQKYTGIDGVIIEDVMVTESMGPIYDRTQEHLGSADAYNIRVRRRLIAAARALAEGRAPAPAVDDPEAFLVRPGTVALPAGADWLEAVELLRRGWGGRPELPSRDIAAVGAEA
jgi:nitrite reductase/ring-hydroxylating ferredoxin subunit